MKKQHLFLAWRIGNLPMLLLVLFVLVSPVKSWADPVAIGTGTVTLNKDNTSDPSPMITNKHTMVLLSNEECIMFSDNGGNVQYSQVDWSVTITPGIYDINLSYGTWSYGFSPTFSIIDPSSGNSVKSIHAPGWQSSDNWNTEANFSTTKTDQDLSDLTPGKTYYIRASMTGGYGLCVGHISFTRIDNCTEYNATFNAAGTETSGSAPSSISKCEDQTFTMPNQGTLFYQGYLFTGWKLNNAGDLITAGTSYTMPAGGASFTAQWEEDNISLHIPATSTLNYANKTGGSSDTRDFYDETCVDLYTTHYVEWDAYITPGSYQISMKYGAPYWGIRGTFSIIDPLGIESTRVFYTQADESNDSSPIYKDHSVMYDLSGLTDGKLYKIKVEHDWGGSYLSIAHIEFTQLGTSHNITFAKGDESVTGSVPADASCAVGGSYTLPGIGTLARVGYSFAGWSDGTNTYAVGDSYTMPDEDVTFTAQWNTMIVPNVTSLSMDNPFNSNIPLTWSIPGICDLSKVMEPFTPNGGAGVGSKDSYTYHYNDGEEYDYVDAQGDSPKWGQYGIGFPITPTTGIEWLSFDYKGEHADMSFWGALYNQNNTAEVYNDFGNEKALNDDENWQESGELHPNKYYWNHDFSGAITDKEITHVAIYVNSGDYGGYDDVQVSIRNVRYHIANQADIDHVVLMRKAGSAATGIDDAGATQLFSGMKSKYTDSEEKTIGTTYYYTVFSVHADGTVSSGATISKTITNDTPHNVTYAKGDENVTGDVPTDAGNYVEGGNVTLAAIGDLAWDNHVFIGWSDGTDIYAVGASYTMPDADVTFTAQWRDLEAPIIIPSEVTHLDANNYHDIPGGIYSFDVDGTGASTCIDIAGNNYAEWKAKFTPGHYRVTLTYGTTGWAVNVTLKIYDGETEVKATAVDHHSDGSGVHTYQRTWGLDLTDLDPDKVYKVRVIDAYSDASSNPKVGYLDFEIVVPTDISNTASTRLDYTNVSVDPGTVEFDIKNNGNSVTCLDIKDHGQADWYVYITPDVYDINMLYGTPEHSTNVTFSIIDPSTSTTVFAPAALTHSGAASTPWYEEKTWNNVDLSGLTAGKQYIVRVADTYSSTGSKPKVQYIDFAKHAVIQIGAFETILNVSNTISTVPTATDVDIDGDGNNDACMNLNNTNAEWEVNIARGIYTMTFEYGVPNYACKVKVELIDPLGVEAPRELLYHALSNDIESGMKARIASRGCDFSDVTEDKVYKVRISDVYGGSGCPLRVRGLSFNPFADTQIPTATRLDASNVFTPNVFTYTNLDVDGDSNNDECLYLRKSDGVTPVEWRVQITPGRYDLTVAYGAVSSGYDITLYLVDPAIGGEGTSLYTNHVSSSGARYQKETITVDWTNLVAGKEYIIRAADTYSDADGCKLRLGYIDFNSYTTHTRTNLHAGDFGTVCLPYAVAAANRTGAELFEIDEWSADGNSLTISELLPDENMVAGRPYIYQATDATASFSYHVEGSEAEAGEYNGLIGSYTQEVIAQDNNNYIIYNNKLYPVNDLAYVGANRAYIHRTAATTPTPAPRRRVTLFLNGTQTATGLDGIQSDNNLQKVLVNGQLFIIREGKTYTVQGQLVTR